MARDYTTTTMVADVKRRASMPSNQALFSDDDIIQFMDEELHTSLVPIIMTLREEFFVVPNEVTLVANQTNYPIPTRSVGTKLRDVYVVLSGGQRYNIPRWSPEMTASRTNRTSNDQRLSFVVQGNNIVLSDSTLTGTISMDYFRRPGHLVAVSTCATVTEVDTLNNRVTTVGRPVAWADGDLLDVTTSVPPFNSPDDDLVIIDILPGGVIELSDVSNIHVGDFLSFDRESPIATIPEEGHNVLKQMAIVKIYESLGNTEEMKSAQAKYTEVVNNFKTLIADRVEGEAKKCVGGTSIGQYTSGFRRTNGRW